MILRAILRVMICVTVLPLVWITLAARFTVRVSVMSTDLREEFAVVRNEWRWYVQRCKGMV